MSQYSIVLQNLRNRVKICASKTGSRRRSRKKNRILKHFLKGTLKGKPPALLYTEKTQSFVLQLPPQHNPHATCMQRLQCVLQHHVHIHAAVTMRFASSRCRTPRENRLRMITRWNHPGRTRRTQEVPFIAGCTHPYTEKHTVSCSGFSSPEQAPCNIHAAITMRLAAWQHHVANAHGNKTWHQSCGHFHCDLPPKLPKHPITTHTRTTTSCRTPRENRFDDETAPAAPAAHTRYLSSLAAATLHGKHTVSAPASFQHNPHATCMQPLQCVLQHHVAHPHLSTHMATKRDTNPAVAEHQGRTDSTMKQPQPHPPHTRGTFHRWPQPLYTEKHKVSCSGFLPTQPPCNMHAAITMRFATSCGSPASLYAHGNKTWHQSCSCRTPRENRFDDETDPATPAAHTRYLSSLAAAALHGKTQGFVLRLPSNTTPMQHACSHYNAFCSTALNECIVMRCKISHRPSWMYRYVM